MAETKSASTEDAAPSKAAANEAAKRQRDVDPQSVAQEVQFPLGQPITSDPENPYRNQLRPLDAEGELVPAGSVMHRVARETITHNPGDPMPDAVIKREGKTPGAVASSEGTDEKDIDPAKDTKKR